MDIKSVFNYIFQNKANTIVAIAILAIIISFVAFILDFIASFVETNDKRTIKIFDIAGDLSQKEKQKIALVINIFKNTMLFLFASMFFFAISYIFDANIISIRIDARIN
jgi:di/tricarboxylate transporter